MNILDEYVKEYPSKQNILDIFKDEWTSKLPDGYQLETKPAVSALFDDDRIYWAEKVFGGFKDLSILELGPLEGGHSYMLEKMGANKIIAIDANTRSFLKCLCIKEIFQIKKVEFRLGNFILFLKNNTLKYDLVFASGVLYHMKEPIEFLKMISMASDKIFLWTHYYDEEIVTHRSDKNTFGKKITIDLDGIDYDGVQHFYKDALNWKGFCGGMNPDSIWLTRDSIIKALNIFGFYDIQISFDEPNHINGPSFAICAKK